MNAIGTKALINEKTMLKAVLKGECQQCKNFADKITDILINIRKFQQKSLEL